MYTRGYVYYFEVYILSLVLLVYMALVFNERDRSLHQLQKAYYSYSAVCARVSGILY